MLIVECMPVEADDILDVHPRKPLLATTERPAKKEPKWQREQAQRDCVTGDHERGAHADDAGPYWLAPIAAASQSTQT